MDEEILIPWRYRTVADPHDLALGHRDQSGAAIVQGNGLTLAEIMAVFDKLPPSVRVSLANSNHPWAPHWAKTALIYVKFSNVIERIESADQREASRHELRLLRGGD